MTINLKNLTPDAVRCLDLAVGTARTRHNLYVDTEHLLIGALQTDIVREAVTTAGNSADAILQAIYREMSIVRDSPLDTIKGLTRDATTALERAANEAQALGVAYVNSGHIALSVLSQPEPFLADILDGLPALDLATIRSSVARASQPPSTNFQEKWRPNRWESGRMLFSEGHGASVASVSGPGPVPGSLRAVRNRSAPTRRNATGQNTNLNTLWIALALLAAVIYGAIVRPDIAVPVTIVLGGWVISLILHEFGHAIVAYWGGDHTVAEKGYLSMNPLKYMHPLLSIGLPLLFLALGGIGLPGGAVYIERHRLRNKYWQSAVSAAGPFMNLICLIVFAIPFWSGYVNANQYFHFWERDTLWAAFAFLVWLQAIAILFNLIPIPPLDGFGIIEPFLEEKLAFNIRTTVGSMGLLLIILMFWIPDDGEGFHPGRAFREQADEMVDVVDVEPWQRYYGWEAFRFWRDD
ncbi:MAG: hypothetical protein GYB66_05475 [Chloroflexi bacterium]|nr:hypothetical protein [Chloroflexota bacterium]